MLRCTQTLATLTTEIVGYGYMAVGSTQSTVTLNFKSHPDVGGCTEPPYPNLSFTSPVPIPPNAYVLGGSSVGTGDRVVIVYDRNNKIDDEFYRAFLQDDGSWDVISSARYDLKTGLMGNNGVSGSVAASGLPILAGLARYDEIVAGSIDHAVAMEVTHSQARFMAPAWRSAGSGNHTASLPPMGLRVRLKSSVDVSSFSTANKVILAALKKYGAVVTDNGSSFFISEPYDTRWDLVTWPTCEASMDLILKWSTPARAFNPEMEFDRDSCFCPWGAPPPCKFLLLKLDPRSNRRLSMRNVCLIGLLISCSSLAQRSPLSNYPLGSNRVADGAVFRVWAPGATSVAVKGDSTNWSPQQLQSEGQSGIWSGHVLKAQTGDRYVYSVTRGQGSFDRPDPEGRALFQNVWSVLLDPNSYSWQNKTFVGSPLETAVIYELHVGSFNPREKNWGTYLSVIEKLDYLKQLGINYIEILPLHKSARPFDWGYGVSLPSSLEDTYGSPDDLKRLVDSAHQRGIGILLDVVHNHYSRASSLICFDGDCQGASGSYFYSADHEHTPWGPRPNFSNPNVREFISNDILRDLNEYHVDGFRWDATPYITTYLDTDTITHHTKNNGENPDGISLLQKINHDMHQRPGVLSIAEYFGAPDSVTLPPEQGGLGFDSHWSGLFEVVRAITQSSPAQISISGVAKSLLGSKKRVIYTESHDEVGHPPAQRRIPTRIDESNPGSLLAQKRALLGAAILMTTPGVPMLFQGQEFLEPKNFTFPTGSPLSWTNAATFGGMLRAYQDLISLRKNDNHLSDVLLGSNLLAFHQNEDAKVLAFRRGGSKDPHPIVVVVNFGDKSFSNYRVGMPHGGSWAVLFSSDDTRYSDKFGGSPHVKTRTADNISYDGFSNSLSLEVAPFTAIVLGDGISPQSH